MFPNLAPDRVEIDLSLGEVIPLASRYGFRAIDLPLEEVAGMRDHEALVAAMNDAGLRWGGFELPLDFRNDRATYDEHVERLKAWLPLAQRLGCDRCYTAAVPGHNELEYKANFAFDVERLRPVTQLLADHGMRLAMEFIGPQTLRDTFRHPFIYTIGGVLKLCEAIAPDARTGQVGILLDSYHWWTSGATEADLLDLLSRDNIVYVHVNDGRAGRSRDEQMDLERKLPCATGLVDAVTFVRALKTLGYDGPVTAEPFDDELKGKSPDENASSVIRSIEKMLTLA